MARLQWPHASTVLAGDHSALQQVIQMLEQKDVFCRLVKVDVASHSPQIKTTVGGSRCPPARCT